MCLHRLKMKYLWLNRNGKKDSLNIQTAGEDYFIGRKYRIQVMDYQQRDSTEKAKRFRSAFTTDQGNYLEQQFKKYPYIGIANRKEVASALNISERAIKIWFQNRRMKEKKESAIKEVDDEQSVSKSLENSKDLFNNVVTSTNEQPRSLRLLTDFNQGNCYKNMAKNNSTSNETRKIVQEQQKFKKEVEDIKKMEEPKSVGFTEQMVPEDLSPSRKVNSPAMGPQQTLAGNDSSNPGLLSIAPSVSPFHTQSYMPASGVIWKSVSVMPFVSSNISPVSASSNPLLNVSPVQEKLAQRQCNCDCHVGQVMPQVPNSIPQQSPIPQYIITALPFQNPTK